MVNRSVTWADWDEELLALELQELKESDVDLSLTGFEDEELATAGRPRFNRWANGRRWDPNITGRGDWRLGALRNVWGSWQHDDRLRAQGPQGAARRDRS